MKMTIYIRRLDEIMKEVPWWVEIDNEQLSTEKAILRGIEYAVKEDWEKVDNEIVPMIKEKFKRRGKTEKILVEVMLRYLLGCGCERGDENRCNCKYLPPRACDNVRDYAATIATELIKEGKEIGDSQLLLLRLKNVAYTDRNPFARMRASMALLEAEKYGYVSDLDYKKLKKNFQDAVKEDPEVEEVIKPYLEKLKEL